MTLYFVGGLFAASPLCSENAGVPEEGAPPNVVFILADDLGYFDLSVYGSEFYETPHIDALAGQGLRFTQAYVASPLCAPTRSSIMTGLDPARTGMTYPDVGHQVVHLDKGLQTPGPATGPFLLAEPVTVLNTDYFTLGEAFKAAGYVTGHYGKWHLGAPPHSPLEHGFAVDIPHTNAPGPLLHGFFHPFHVWPGKGEDGDHLEDLLAGQAARFILENKDRPFFLNYWAFQVHSPWEAKEEQIERYAAKADSESLQRNPVYAGMVESLDEAVGTLLAALDEAGVRENTVIVFLSDNGPFVAAHPAPVMDPRFTEVPPTSVLPLRGGKKTLYEGGIRVPQIIVWPGLTEPGSVTDALSHSNDFFPTFVDLLGWEDPRLPAFDGVSLRSALMGGPGERESIFAHFPHRQDTRPYENMPFPNSSAPAASLRVGDWKLIRFFAAAPDGSDRFELYNLANDLSEVRDLAAVERAQARHLNARLDAILTDRQAVIPVVNPTHRARQEASAPWQVSPQAEARAVDGALHILSKGRDPWISTRALDANASGPFQLTLEMNSHAAGEGRVYFVPRAHAGFNETQSIAFPITHDGQPHVYTLEIDTDSLTGLRIDPANQPGELALIGIQLTDREGNSVTLPDF
jgi:arylsulfatase A-like enzyme